MEVANKNLEALLDVSKAKLPVALEGNTEVPILPDLGGIISLGSAGDQPADKTGKSTVPQLTK